MLNGKLHFLCSINRIIASLSYFQGFIMAMKQILIKLFVKVKGNAVTLVISEK